MRGARRDCDAGGRFSPWARLLYSDPFNQAALLTAPVILMALVIAASMPGQRWPPCSHLPLYLLTDRLISFALYGYALANVHNVTWGTKGLTDDAGDQVGEKRRMRRLRNIVAGSIVAADAGLIAIGLESSRRLHQVRELGHRGLHAPLSCRGGRCGSDVGGLGVAISPDASARPVRALPSQSRARGCSRSARRDHRGDAAGLTPGDRASTSSCAFVRSPNGKSIACPQATVIEASMHQMLWRQT